ncbi:MAG TPA: MFS transporter [Candidatus Methylomirabilis sp.]|nr:MFS transporter [Candidatus Methylomirabilis sp.]
MKPDLGKLTSSRRGWTILATTFTTLAVIYGLWYSYSVFLVVFIREFGWSRSLVAGAFSVFSAVHGGLGPLIGWMLWRVGPRRLMLVGGIVMGIGLGLTAQTTVWWHLYLAFGGITALGISLTGWVPLVVLVQGWFPDRFGTAMGIASAGIGMGILGFVPLSQLLVDCCGWRWTFRILAALTVCWVLPAAFWLVQDPPAIGRVSSSPRESRETAASTGYWTLAAAVRTWRFWGLAGVYFMGNFVTQMLMIHQVAYLVDHGVAALLAATVGGMVGLISIVAKIGWGIFSDRYGRELAYSLATGCVVASIGFLVLAGRDPTSSLPYAYAVFMAFGYGVLSGVFPAVASDLYGGRGFSTIYGALYTVICLALASGPWAAGQVFDSTGSYAMAFWIGLAMAVLSQALLWVVAPRRPNPPPTIH